MGNKRTLVVEFRVSPVTLARLAAFYSKNGELANSRAGLISDAIADYELLLSKHRKLPNFGSVSEALEFLERVGLRPINRKSGTAIGRQLAEEIDLDTDSDTDEMEAIIKREKL